MVVLILLLLLIITSALRNDMHTSYTMTYSLSLSSNLFIIATIENICMCLSTT